MQPVFLSSSHCKMRLKAASTIFTIVWSLIVVCCFTLSGCSKWKLWNDWMWSDGSAPTECRQNRANRRMFLVYFCKEWFWYLLCDAGIMSRERIVCYSSSFPLTRPLWCSNFECDRATTAVFSAWSSECHQRIRLWNPLTRDPHHPPAV